MKQTTFKRKMSTDKYIIAAFLTLVIFALGLLLGLVIEGSRADYVSQMAKSHELNYNSIQLQYLYIDQLGSEGNCPAVLRTLDNNIEELVKTADRLETYEKDSKIKKGDFDVLKHEYLLSQIRYWLLSKKAREICGGDYVTVLYFYSTEKECPDCEQQAFILTYFKKIFKDKLLNFALDAHYTSEPLIEILKKTYNVQSYPTLVIENKAFNGFTDQKTIVKEICSHFSNQTFNEFKNECSVQ